jgi:PAS domain S-box-containing protein
MVGLAADHPIEQTEILDYYSPEQRSFAAEVIVKSMIERGRWSGETCFRDWRTGEAIPVSYEHFLIHDPRSERVLGMGTITRDISEARRVTREREESLEREHIARRQAEAARDQLRESEERFRLTIDEAPIGMALVALDGRFVRVNQALCEIVGYEPAELIRMTFQEITHPDDLDADLALMNQLLGGRIPRYQLEKRYVRKDRAVVDIMLSGSILRGEDGTARSFIAQIEDITDRKRAEEALRRSEAKFSGIVSIAAEAIVSVDEEQRIIIFNEGAERTFGYAKDEVIGRPLDLLIPERFRAVHRSHFTGFATGPEPARVMGERREVLGLRKSGEEFPAEASISKVEVGNEAYVSVVLRDVTARKRAEAAMQEAIAARDRVLGIVAHDLRNPLSTILMTSSVLDRADPEQRQRAKERIVSAAKRMNRLIQDLLDVGLVEAGEMKVAREQVSPDELVRDAVEAQRCLADDARLEIRVDLERGVPDVFGDRDRLLQVFENLIGNAMKFTGAGGRITVGAASRDDDIVFRVADTGCGIAERNLPHAFDRFWQAAARSSRLGSGLGLPITRGIVEAHGGRIWVESVLGWGSTFYFTIPKASSALDRVADVGR